jgi:iron uptake system component EfeO
MSRRPTSVFGALGVLVLLATAVACTDNKDAADADDGGALSVTSTNTECKVSKTTAPSGNLRFSVTNDGSKVTEFYLLAADGMRIVGEVENVGPGATRDLVVTAEPGTYQTACKPGMVGDGIRSGFKVTDSGKDLAPKGRTAAAVKTAIAQYELYVKDQTEQLLTKTEEFADLYKAGKDDEARALYADARAHWERIEPVAESFGTLDPRLDLREADLEEGQKWTGWHAIEKDLWPPKSGYTALTQAERDALADQLVADTEELEEKVEDDSFTFTADQLGNGAKGLLDEVATGKVTGEEEAWSHTDLWDFQANVDGARIAYENLKPVLEEKDPQLAKTLQTRFDDLQALLDEYKDGDGFVSYTELTDEQVKELSDAVNALSEPLSQLTAAVVS